MGERGVDRTQFDRTVGVADIDGAKVFGTEPGKTLFGDRGADFLNGIEMGNFGEDLFLFRVHHKEREIFRVETAQDFMAQIQQDLVDIGRGENLPADPLDVFRVAGFESRVA